MQLLTVFSSHQQDTFQCERRIRASAEQPLPAPPWFGPDLHAVLCKRHHQDGSSATEKQVMNQWEGRTECSVLLIHQTLWWLCLDKLGNTISFPLNFRIYYIFFFFYQHLVCLNMFIFILQANISASCELLCKSMEAFGKPHQNCSFTYH